ncbi:MAG: endonuclease MutS2 [Oscillospiraceae bacterium]|jgi:DNA mismatch repair protein MutS2|nr:endonuclease MutS2 [Oscillospiraceae bacterium]
MTNDYKKLELDKILSLLSEQAWSDGCKEKIAGIEPLFKISVIREELQKTDDAFTLSAKFGTPRFSRIKDTCDCVKRAGSGASLSLRELLDICAVIKSIGGLVSWYSQCSGIENTLAGYFSVLVPNKALSEKIDNAILSDEALSDSASPELARIRKAIIRQGQHIREQLDKLVKNPDKQKFLQENIITTRDGRFVVPVRIEYKGEISGLVHDTSASGQTLFIEPMAVVEANNEIRLLKGQEQAEVERIIAELSSDVGDFSEALILGYETLIKLEMYFAKANLGARMKAVTPEIVEYRDLHNRTPVLRLIKARHPLINQDTVVPVTIELGFDYTCLIITGPNTGGKTVAIKTAGLLTLMAMCGLMIPAADGSKVGLFGGVYADIGDEQSIEQSLSTFSSHMNNITRILKAANQNSLVLLDELGSGTDPVEGSALAVSILEYLKSRSCLVLATTHYQEVKMFAIEEEGVENASCEFDINTLKPTYRLITGMPGKSQAFAIAQRLGLDEQIIKSAERHVTGESKRFEKTVEALEAARIELEAAKSEIEEERIKTLRNSQSAEKMREQTEFAKEKELQAARNKASGIINEVRHIADGFIDELEQLRREKDKEDFSERVRSARSKLNKTLDKMHDTANPVSIKKQETYILPRPLKIYDTVLLVDIDKKGTLLTLPDKSGNCMVQVGLMKTKTNQSQLRLIEEKAEDKIKINSRHISTKGLQSNATRQTGMELDIRGMAADEGVLEVDRFIDSSIMGGLQLITIIHGKGTGILRGAVHQFLKGHRQVKNYRLGVYGEGESGVTVIELK